MNEGSMTQYKGKIASRRSSEKELSLIHIYCSVKMKDWWGDWML